MADEEPIENEPKKKSKLPLIIGLVLMLLLGGGGFFAVYSGLILSPPAEPTEAELAELTTDPVDPLPDVAFVAIDPLIINLASPSAGNRHLRFHAQIEVPSLYEEEVLSLLPRIVDVLNGYLRALDVTDFEAPAALVKLRSQMLRRLQIVAGEERIRDVLIMEFVIN
ncbi:flagellar FliL protein [Pacificibacter maritimus]|uniref:Flagellar protein FliL n=2 Tax=Pacificibacter maritimus TaxID=762213 RepID=A0A3N4UC46_9RHOB|nr:flagellar basal body-associated FliL family protein [Pacificibacter maritimus]RPE64629.1 flagellar FliL protein [Pacificibacter maritimus]